MSTDAAPIFDAALGLPETDRADLAARLLESLEPSTTPVPSRSRDEWEQFIKDRCDQLHREDAVLIDGDVAIAMLRATIDRVAPPT